MGKCSILFAKLCTAIFCQALVSLLIPAACLIVFNNSIITGNTVNIKHAG